MYTRAVKGSLLVRTRFVIGDENGTSANAYKYCIKTPILKMPLLILKKLKGVFM